MTLTSHAAPPGPTVYSRRWAMLPLILFGTFLGLFDRFVVIVATPAIQQDLSAGHTAIELIVAGYGFSYACGLITGGRLGDLFGFRRLFAIGMAGFTAASLLCGLAQTPAQLVAARLVQGLAAAVMVPQVLALITAVFAPDERPRAVSWFGATIGISSVAGQVMGGVLVQAWGWRTIFLVNVPLGVVAVVAALRLLPAHTPARRPGLDLAGVAGITLSLGLTMVALVFGRGLGWPWWIWLCLVASVLGLARVMRWEADLAARGGTPLLDRELLRNRFFVAGLACNIAFMAFFGGLLLAVSVVLQSGMGLSPLRTGLTFLPLGVTLAVASIVARRFVARYGSKLIAAGSAVTLLGLLALLALVYFAAFTPAWLAVPMTLIGLGQGMAYPLLIGVTLAGVAPHQAGGGSGVLTTAQQFAGAVGVALLEVLFFHSHGARPAALIPVLLFDIALVVAVIGLSRLLPKPAKR